MSRILSQELATCKCHCDFQTVSTDRLTFVVVSWLWSSTDAALLSAPGGRACVETRFDKCYRVSYYHLIILPHVSTNEQEYHVCVKVRWLGRVDDRRVTAGCVTWQMSLLFVSLDVSLLIVSFDMSLLVVLLGMSLLMCHCWLWHDMCVWGWGVEGQNVLIQYLSCCVAENLSIVAACAHLKLFNSLIY